MMRIRRALDAAILAVVIRILTSRLNADRRELTLSQHPSAVEQARSLTADRAQALWATALTEVPALFSIAARLPAATIPAAVIEGRRRRSTVRTLLVAVTVAAITTAIAFTIAALVRRRRASRAPVSVTPVATTTLPKEPVVIPIVVSLEESRTTGSKAERKGEPSPIATTNATP